MKAMFFVSVAPHLQTLNSSQLILAAETWRLDSPQMEDGVPRWDERLSCAAARLTE